MSKTNSIRFFNNPKAGRWLRFVCWVVLLAFSFNTLCSDVARADIMKPQTLEILPPVGTLVDLTPAFTPPNLKAISIDPKDPFKIDFILDTTNQSKDKQANQDQLEVLIKYFLGFLTLPEENLWVNLSPYEKDRIVDPNVETTNIGRDMLLQDYTLKQLSCSLTYPEREPGRTFWKKIFDRAKSQYGSSNVPINSFNKVWVVPDKAVVYEHGNSAYISESHLKVLLDEDYLSLQKHGADKKVENISAQIAREIIIPELEREVNEGKTFAPLRQMYNALILAIWFKKELKGNLINQIYADQKKTDGISLLEKEIKEKIYTQYLRSVKKGVYNFIREDLDPISQEKVPHKYFSGGFSFAMASKHIGINQVPEGYIPSMLATQMDKDLSRFSHAMISLIPKGATKAALVSLIAGAAFMVAGTGQAQAGSNYAAFRTTPPIHQTTAVQIQDKQILDNYAKGHHWKLEGTKIDNSFNKPEVVLKAKPVQMSFVERLFTSTSVKATIYYKGALTPLQAQQIWYDYLRNDMKHPRWQISSPKKDRDGDFIFTPTHPLGDSGGIEPPLPLGSDSTQVDDGLLPKLDLSDVPSDGILPLVTPDSDQPVAKAVPIPKMAESNAPNADATSNPQSIVKEILSTIAQGNINATIENGRLVIPVSTETVSLKDNRDQIAWDLSHKVMVSFVSSNGLHDSAPARVFFKEGRISLQLGSEVLKVADQNTLKLNVEGKTHEIAVGNQPSNPNGQTKSIAKTSSLEPELPQKTVAPVTPPQPVATVSPVVVDNTSTTQAGGSSGGKGGPPPVEKDHNPGTKLNSSTPIVTVATVTAPVLATSPAKVSSSTTSSSNSPVAKNNAGNKDDWDDWSEEMDVPSDVPVKAPSTLPAVYTPTAAKASSPVVLVSQPVNPPQASAPDNSKPLATIDVNVEPQPLNGKEIKAPREGVIRGLDVAKKEYKKGEIIFSVEDPKLREEIKKLESIKEILEDTLNKAREQQLLGNVAPDKVREIEAQLNKIKGELSVATQNLDSSRFIAPHDLKIETMPKEITNGGYITKDAPLFTYTDLQFISVKFNYSGPIDFNNVGKNMTIAGIPVISIVGVEVLPSTEYSRENQIRLIVVTKNKLPEGQTALHAELYPLNNGFSNLSTIEGKIRTDSKVASITETIIPAPEKGEVIFKVGPGQQVQKGQTLAIVNPKNLLMEYKSIVEELANLGNIIKAQEVNPTLIITEINKLKIKEAELIAKRDNLKDQIKRLIIVAPYDGTLSEVNSNLAKVFNQGDVLFKIRAGEVVVGKTVGEPTLKLKDDQGRSVKEGDPVLVVTDDGPLPGVVLGVEKAQSGIETLKGYKAVSVKVFDLNNTLNVNSPVTVILPKDHEKQLILDLIANIEKGSHSIVGSGNPPPEDSDQMFDEMLAQLNPIPKAIAIRTITIPSVTTPIASLQGIPLSIPGVISGIKDNELTAGREYYTYLQELMKEGSSRDMELRIGGKVVFDHKKTSIAGEVSGSALGGLLNGGLTSGNVYSAGWSMGSKLLGSLVSILRNDPQHIEEILREATKVANNNTKMVESQKVLEGEVMLIKIGVAQQKLIKLRSQEELLKKVLNSKVSSQKAGFSTPKEVADAQQEYDSVRSEIIESERLIGVLTVHLNRYIGSRDSHRLYKASLNWEESFSGMSKDEENDLRSRLRIPDERNPSFPIRSALAAKRGIELAAKLATHQENDPFVQITNLLLGENGTAARADYIAGTIVKTSSLEQGPTTVLDAGITLYSDKNKRNQANRGIEIEKADLEIGRAFMEESERLAEAAENMRKLSLQRKQMIETIKHLLDVLNSKVADTQKVEESAYSADEVSLLKAQQKLIEIEGSYMEQKAALRRMGLSVPEKRDPTGTLSKLGGVELGATYGSESSEPKAAHSNIFDIPGVQPALFKTDGQSNPDFVLVATGGNGQGVAPVQVTGLRAGNVTIPDNLSTVRLSLMFHRLGQGDAGDAADIKILREKMKDSNINNRQEAVHIFLNEYQDNSDFQMNLRAELLDSDRPDIIYEILKFMSEQQDIHSLIDIINEAEGSKRTVLADLGYQFLADALSFHPEVLKGFIQGNSSAGAFHDVADKVFLTLAIKEGVDSLAVMHMIQSNWWSYDDLVKINSFLNDYINGHKSNDPQTLDKVDQLKELTDNLIMQEKGLKLLEDEFKLGTFEDIGGYPWWFDLYYNINIPANGKANKQFLEHSSNLGKMYEFIKPSLAKRIKEAVEKDQRDNQGLSNLNVSFFDLRGVQPHVGMDYLSSFSLERQNAYIAKVTYIPELVRFLKMGNATALKPLMKTFEGRLEVLRIYNNSDDPVILKLINNLPWRDTLKSDISKIDNPIVDDIFRKALIKLDANRDLKKYQDDRTFLNLRVGLVPDIELTSLEDPRGPQIRQAAIYKAGIKRGLAAFKKGKDIKPYLLPDAKKYSGDELKEIQALEEVLERDGNPQEVEDYLNDRITRVKGDALGTLKKIVKYGKEFSGDIKKNNQNIPFPWVSFFSFTLPGLVGLIGLYLFIRGKLHDHWVKKAAARELLDENYPNIVGLADKDQTNVKVVIDENDKNAAMKTSSSLENRVIVYPPENMYPPTKSSLYHIASILTRWTKKKPSIEQLLIDLNRVLVDARKVQRAMPYDPDLVFNKGDEGLNSAKFQRSFGYLYGLTANILIQLGWMLKDKELPPREQRLLEIIIKQLFGYYDESTRFLEYFSHRYNAERVLRDKFPDSYLVERWHINPAFREFRGFGHLLRGAVKGMNGVIPEILEGGEELSPGLYLDRIQNLVDESKVVLKETIRRGRTSFDLSTSLDRRVNRWANFTTQLMAMILAFYVFAPFLGFHLPGTGTHVEFPFKVILGYIIYWRTNISNLQMKTKRKSEITKDKIINQDLAGVISPTLFANKIDEEQRLKEIISLYREEAKEEIGKEAKRAEPNTDIIVFVPQKNEGKLLLDEFISSRQANGSIRTDIPAFAVNSIGLGSGTEYLQIRDQLRTEFDQFKESGKYPHLAGKAFEEVNVLMVFHGEEVINLEKQDQFKFLDLALERGFLARKDRFDDKGNLISKDHGGVIPVYTRDAVYSPTIIPKVPNSGITITGSLRERSALKFLGLIGIDEGETVKRMRHGLDIKRLLATEEIARQKAEQRKLRDGVSISPKKEDELEELRKDGYLLELDKLKQFPVSDGMFLMAPDAVKAIDRIINYLKEKNLWGKMNVHFTADILIPFIMASRYENSERINKFDEYLVHRLKMKDMSDLKQKPKDQQEELLRDLYEFIGIVYDKNPFYTDSFVIDPHISAFFHIAGKESGVELERLRELDLVFSSRPTNAAMASPVQTVAHRDTVSASPVQVSGIKEPVTEMPYKIQVSGEEKAPGGIDLSKTRNGIVFNGDRSSIKDGARTVSLPLILKSFQGFEFQIDQYKPILNSQEFALYL